MKTDVTELRRRNAERMRQRRGHQPRYAGPCICGCGREGRGNSGLAPTCYKRAWNRRATQRRICEIVLGDYIPFSHLVDVATLGPLSKATHQFVLKLLTALDDGRVQLYRPKRG